MSETGIVGEPKVEMGSETTPAVKMPRVEDGMRCPVCPDGKAPLKWYDLGVVSESAGDPPLHVCVECGFIAYPVKEEDEAAMLDYYRKDYRSAPTHKNLLTTTNKLNYILKALKPILDKAKADKKQLVCGDWGCATGYIPDALRKRGHRATGSEYTTGFRRFAEAYYGIAVAEELPEKHKYDLLTCYHVLEHMMAPDKKLAKMRDLLADDGRIFLSTPEWLADLEVQSGEDLRGVGHYYHKNHINAFTAAALKRLIAKAGLVIEWEDHVVYGQTYLLRKAKAGEAVPVPAENPSEVVAKVRSTIDAIRAYMAGDLRGALAIYPAFPEAWLATIYQTYGKDPKAQEAHFKMASDALPNNVRLYSAFGGWLFQNERFADAERVFTQILNTKPNSEAMVKLGWCAIHRKDYPEAIRYFEAVASICPTAWAEMMELVCSAASKMPHWEERARAEAEKVFKAQAQTLKVEPKDPGMEPKP